MITPRNHSGRLAPESWTPVVFHESSGPSLDFRPRQCFTPSWWNDRVGGDSPKRRRNASFHDASANVARVLAFSNRLLRAFGPQTRAALGCAILVFIETAALTAQTNTASPFRPLATVNGTPRSTELDVVQLADGGTLRGKVVNQRLTLHTSYGSIPLNVEWLAGIEFDQSPDHFDRIATINRNRLSGFMNEEVAFHQESGKTVQLQKTAIRQIVFHQRETEASLGNTRRFLDLENGDLLSGQLLNWRLQIKTDTASTVPSLDDVEMAQFAKDTRDLQILLRTGKEEAATLAENSLRLELDLGPEIVLPASLVKTLFARTSSLPLPVRRAFGEAASASIESASKAPGPTPNGMVWIQPGRFQMGSLPGEKGHGTDEVPPTEVILTHGFWMGAREVTQAEYVAVMGTNPSGFQGETNHPVEKVTWNEANAYCEKRTDLERGAGRLPVGFVYRLPTEAEWEYACRAGTTTRFSYGDDPTDTGLEAYAWFARNSNSSTQPVGQLKPNAWGLYDMHGNVWEWCHDLWQDPYPGGTVTNYTGPTNGWLRVARGGSWLYDTAFCRSANRDSYGPDNRCSDIGFRVVLGPPL